MEPNGGGPATGDDAGVSPSSGLPCEVDEILEKNCRTCHTTSPLFGAPMPLVTWDDLHAPAPSDGSKKVYEHALERISSDTTPMPPPPNPRLEEQEYGVLADWIAQGAPRGTDACEAKAGPGDTEPLVSCTPDIVLEPSEPWEMPADVVDEYVCWGVDLTRTPARHITAFAPRIDNKTITHHVVLFEADESFPSKPTPCNSSGSLRWRMVLGWAPGAKGIELPSEAGFPIGTTEPTHYVVQMHYSNVQRLAGERDASKIELCTEPPRKYEADVLAFGTHDIRIPPHPPAGGVYERECSVTVPAELAGIHLFAAMPHMHKLGVSMKTLLYPSAGGAPVDLGTMSSFDFNTQAWLPIQAVTAPGDVITTTCGWTNNTGEEVRFGEKTSDEMCYSFTMYYPRITHSVWSWAAPALLAECKN